MGSFLNIDLGKKTPREFIWKHVLFSTIWLLFILVLIFRIDVYAIDLIPENFKWIINTLPLILIGGIAFTVLSQQWYYSLAAIFYPILLIFWFFPKNILDNGKIYLFGHYVNYIFIRLKRLKQTIIHFIIFSLSFIFLLLTDSPWVRFAAILVASFFYLRFVTGYLKLSFKPAELFGGSLEKSLKEFIEGGKESNQKLIELAYTGIRPDKLTEEEIRNKQLNRLVILNHAMKFISNNLNSFKGKKAFVISWVLQLGFFLIISITYFTFLNYQIYKIAPDNFSVNDTPSMFEFFYYTFKTITFNGIESIKPNSVIAKIIEIVSYFVIGVFLLIVAASVVFSLRQDKG